MKQNQEAPTKEQIRAVKTRALSNRGIGREYHFGSIAQITGDENHACIDIVNSFEPSSGHCITVFGKTNIAFDLFMLMARGLVIRGVDNLLVIPFTEILSPEPELVAKLRNDKPALFITGFLPDRALVDPQEYTRIEAFLMRYYLNDCIPLGIHIPTEYNENLKTIDHGDLLSDAFFGKLLSRSAIIDGDL